MINLFHISSYLFCAFQVSAKDVPTIVIFLPYIITILKNNALAQYGFSLLYLWFDFQVIRCVILKLWYLTFKMLNKHDLCNYKLEVMLSSLDINRLYPVSHSAGYLSNSVDVIEIRGSLLVFCCCRIFKKMVYQTQTGRTNACTRGGQLSNHEWELTGYNSLLLMPTGLLQRYNRSVGDCLLFSQ